MSESLDRRTLLKVAAASAVTLNPFAEAFGAQADGLQFDPPVPFSYESFKYQARDRGHAPYVPPPRPAQEVLQKINYEEWGKIRYRNDYALFANGPGEFPVTFFHLGRFFQKPVNMYVVERDLADPLRQRLFRHACRQPGARAARWRGLRGLPVPGEPPRPGQARLAQQRLGRLPRRLLFPRDRRALPVRPVRTRRRARRRRPRKPEEFPDFTQVYFDRARLGHRSLSTRCSTVRASPAPTASR